MVSRIVLNLRSENSWTDHGDSTPSSGNGGYARRYTGTGFQASFLTRAIGDLEPGEDIKESTVADNTDSLYPGVVIPMTSMEMRRKLDSITSTV